MDSLTNQLKKRAAIISLIVGIGMFIFKVGAYLITCSAAIFSDAAESVVHVAATSVALMSIIISSRPADKSHFYGHGNVEYFSAGAEGLLIIIAAFTILYTATLDLIQGVTIKSLDTGLIIILIASAVNLVLGFYLIREGKKYNSLTLEADGKHVLTDSFTSFGVVVGVGLVMLTGIKELDPILAIIIALNILFTGYQLIRQSVKGLMLEADEEKLEVIVNVLKENRKDYWIDIHQLRYWESGERVFIDFHLIMPNYFTIDIAHKEMHDIEDKIRESIPGAQVLIHMDYCHPALCKLCRYDICEKRIEKYSKNAEWDTNKLTGPAIAAHDS